MNRIKAIRTKLGLTQRQLAERAGTSQQQIQRVESGAVAARLDLAGRISAALGESMEKLFPKSSRAVEKFRGEQEPGYMPSSESYSQVAETGVELDPRVWTLLLQLRGHAHPLPFVVEPNEKRRLFTAVQGESDGTLTDFVVFDTTTHRVAVNLQHLICCQFLFDPPGILVVKEKPSGDEEEHEETFNARVIFAGLADVRLLNVEYGDDEIQEVFDTFESSPLPHERVHFVDSDGESVFLRASDVALLEVELSVLDLDLLPSEEDDAIEA